jgi:hypothetical protein
VVGDQNGGKYVVHDLFLEQSLVSGSGSGGGTPPKGRPSLGQRDPAKETAAMATATGTFNLCIKNCFIYA